MINVHLCLGQIGRAQSTQTPLRLQQCLQPSRLQPVPTLSQIRLATSRTQPRRHTTLGRVLVWHDHLPAPSTLTRLVGIYLDGSPQRRHTALNLIRSVLTTPAPPRDPIVRQGTRNLLGRHPQVISHLSHRQGAGIVPQIRQTLCSPHGAGNSSPFAAPILGGQPQFLDLPANHLHWSAQFFCQLLHSRRSRPVFQQGGFFRCPLLVVTHNSQSSICFMRSCDHNHTVA